MWGVCSEKSVNICSYWFTNPCFTCRYQDCRICCNWFAIRGLFKKYPTWFHPPPRGNYWSTGGVLWEEGGEYLHAHTWIFSRQQTASVACSQRVSGSVYTARVALLFSAKMTERLEQRYCIKICQKLGDSQVENIRKIQRVFGDDAMGITQIKSGTTDSKMAARRWRVTLVPVGPRQAEMTSSMTKCGLWSCRTVVSPFENLRRRWE